MAQLLDKSSLQALIVSIHARDEWRPGKFKPLIEYGNKSAIGSMNNSQAAVFRRLGIEEL